MKTKITISLFAGLFLYYSAICIYTLKTQPENDEWRYLGYANNLTKGFFAPKDTLMLWNGPGYPLVLYPFVKTGLPFWAGKCLNPFFLLGGCFFLYRLLRLYVGHNKALSGALLFGLYPPLLPDMVKLLTESFSIFLICGFCFFAVQYSRKKHILTLLHAGLFGGILILTKLAFAYVIMAGLFIAILWAVMRDKEIWRLAAICGFSLLFCTPYLFYTWSLTHRFLYWGNAGGSLLYWITDPCPNHLGDWHSETVVFSDVRYASHKPLFENLKSLNYVQQDDLLKREALQSLKTYPKKFLYNCISNAGRLWLNYPFTYKEQRPHTLFYMVPNAILLGGLVFCIYPLTRALRQINKEIIALILFMVIYLTLVTILPSNPRYLVPVVPVLIFILFYTCFMVLEIRFKNSNTKSETR